jgi:hypothetical protein
MYSIRLIMMVLAFLLAFNFAKSAPAWEYCYPCQTVYYNQVVYPTYYYSYDCYPCYCDPCCGCYYEEYSWPATSSWTVTPAVPKSCCQPLSPEKIINPQPIPDPNSR